LNPTFPRGELKVRSRTAVAFVAALFLVLVPAAFATSAGVLPAVKAPKPAQPKALPSPAVKAVVSRQAKVAVRRLARQKRRASVPKVSVPPQMAAIAQCESHGNPRSIGGGGLYRGKYQMTTSIWASVGGKGDPAAASEAEQDRRAALLYQRSGPGQWPVCGQ
jgi:hypothetical protein